MAITPSAMVFADYIAIKMARSSIASQERGYAGQDLVDHHRRVEAARIALLPAFRDATTPVLEKYAGCDVLEIGCGTGFFYRRIAPGGMKRRMLCLDINSLSLKEFRRLDPEARLLRGSVYSLPFGDENFDTITGYSSLDSVLFLGEALAETRRVLKRGGKLVLFQDLTTDMYLLDGECENTVNVIRAVERYHERLAKEAAKAGFEILEGENLLTGNATETIESLNLRAGRAVPFATALEWDRGVHSDLWGLRKVYAEETGSVEERVKMRYLVAIK